MAAAVAAFSAHFIVLQLAPVNSAKDVYTMTYMDTLEADSSPEVMAYAAPVPALEGAQEESR